MTAQPIPLSRSSNNIRRSINASSSSIEQIINEINETELSSMGSLFQNSVESVFDEFGESVSTEEKIAILSSMLKKYL